MKTIIALTITFAVLIFIYIWSSCLLFYKEKAEVLKSDEDKVFSPDNRSIVKTQSSDRAILFIHGFPTTPYMYKNAAEYAYDKGYDVYAPLIPTFGADYKEFAKTNFSSWYLYIKNYYSDLRERYKELYVVGVSMGGMMTLKLAEDFSATPMAMDGIAVLSAPVVYNSLFKYGVVTNFLAYFGRIVGLFTPYIFPKNVTEHPDCNDGDEAWHGYGGTFPRQGVSIMYNTKEIRENLSRISVPMIAIHDYNDKTVPYKNHEIIKSLVSTERSKYIETDMPSTSINSHHALLSYDSTYRPLMDEILSFFESN